MNSKDARMTIDNLLSSGIGIKDLKKILAEAEQEGAKKKEDAKRKERIVTARTKVIAAAVNYVEALMDEPTGTIDTKDIALLEQKLAELENAITNNLKVKFEVSQAEIEPIMSFLKEIGAV